METNGLASDADDLLSISIFKPDDLKIYNRFLPLELNDEVLTTQINGITARDLKDRQPLDQQEVDRVIREFELQDRQILTYGTLDEKFLRSYFSRKNLKGFEVLKFYNFKQDILSPRTTHGAVSKDNLCIMMGIDHVQKVHTAENDCILEWELFKKMNGQKMLMIGNRFYRVEKGYRIPAQYLRTYPNVKYAVKGLPRLKAKTELVWQQQFYTDCEEHGIKEELMSRFKTLACHPWEFLEENEKKLSAVGVLEQIPQTQTLLGVPHISENLSQKLDEIAAKITEELFCNDKMYSYELITDDQMYAIQDISSNSIILDIREDITDLARIRDEMKFKSLGRECYGLLIHQETEIVTFSLVHLQFQ